MKTFFLKTTIAILSAIIFYECSQEPYDFRQENKLTVVTGDILNLSYTSASVVIEIDKSNTNDLHDGGVCYGENENPTIEKDKYINEYNIRISSTVNIKDLSPNTKYYCRAFAYDNDNSIIYGNTKSFTTLQVNYKTEGNYYENNHVYRIKPGRIVWYCYNENPNITSLNIPSTVNINNLTYKVNGVEGMRGFTKLKSVYFPNTIDTIADGAFYSCGGLTTIDIKETIKYIGNSFVGTTWARNIKGYKYIHNIFFQYGGETGPDDVEINEGTTLISPQAFFFFRTYKTLNLPSSLYEIAHDAFPAADNLIKITINASTPPIVGENNFSNTNKETCVLHVPASSIDKYKNDIFWGQFKNIQAL